MELPTSHDEKPGEHELEKGDRSWNVTNGFAGMLYEDVETGEQFYVTYKADNHLFRKKESWPVSSSIIGDLDSLGVDYVMIVHTDEGDVYIHEVQDYVDADVIDFDGYDKQQAPNMGEAEQYNGVLNPEERSETYPDRIVV